MTKSDPPGAVMFQASISAPCSATKSSTTCAPLPPVRSLTASTCLPSATTVTSAPSCSASLSASGLRSTTMIRVAEAAGADDDGGGAGVEQRQRLADGVVGGDPGVRQRRHVGRLRAGVELDAGAGAGE